MTLSEDGGTAAVADEEKTETEEKDADNEARSVGEVIREQAEKAEAQRSGDGGTDETKDQTKADDEDEETKEGEDSDKDKPPALTAEELEALASRPEVREAVMGTQDTQDSLDTMVRQALTEADDKKETEKVRAEQAKTVEEALKKGEEDGDYSELGRIAADNLAKNRERASVAPGIRTEIANEYDSAVATVYGEEIEALSEEDRKALNRSKFDSDGDYIAAVFTKLKEQQATLIRASAGAEVKDANEAAANATAAAKAREDGDAGLKGGTADKDANLNDNIGDLMREGIKDTLPGYEE